MYLRAAQAVKTKKIGVRAKTGLETKPALHSSIHFERALVIWCRAKSKTEDANCKVVFVGYRGEMNEGAETRATERRPLNHFAKSNMPPWGCGATNSASVLGD